MRTSSLDWAAGRSDAPRPGETVVHCLSGWRFEVTHVGRLVWLYSARHGLVLEPIADLWRRYNRKQLALALFPAP